MNPVHRVRWDLDRLMSIMWRFLVSGLLLLTVALPLFFQTPQSLAPPTRAPSKHPDVCGTWVRSRENSVLYCECPGGKTVPVFGERVHISLSSTHFRVGHT